MYDFDAWQPAVEELAAVEAELPEWERLAVRDHWDAVITEELGAPVSKAIEAADERARLLRVSRRSRSNVVALFPPDCDKQDVSAAEFGEAA